MRTALDCPPLETRTAGQKGICENSENLGLHPDSQTKQHLGFGTSECYRNFVFLICYMSASLDNPLGFYKSSWKPLSSLGFSFFIWKISSDDQRLFPDLTVYGLSNLTYLMQVKFWPIISAELLCHVNGRGTVSTIQRLVLQHQGIAQISCPHSYILNNPF